MRQGSLRFYDSRLELIQSYAYIRTKVSLPRRKRTSPLHRTISCGCIYIRQSSHSTILAHLDFDRRPCPHHLLPTRSRLTHLHQHVQTQKNNRHPVLHQVGNRIPQSMPVLETWLQHNCHRLTTRQAPKMRAHPDQRPCLRSHNHMEMGQYWRPAPSA